MDRFKSGLLVGVLLLSAASAGAQAVYPHKPVRLIVPIAAGGPSDAAARILAKGMSIGLGQEVRVENRPGGNNGVGAAVVLNAPPDGYTLLFALVANAGLPYLSKAAPYASLTEFTPVASIGGNTLCLVVPGHSPVKTLAAFAAGAKAGAKPPLRGANSAAEDMLAGQITQALGFEMERVPYKGSAQALPDLLEGRIDAAVLPVGFSAPHVRSGRLTMLGCSASKRFAALPSVPTLAESGVSSPPLVTAHFVLGPPQLPQDIVDRIAKAVQQAAAAPDFKQEMDRLLISGGARSPTETRELIVQAEAQYVQFVRETGASVD